MDLTTLKAHIKTKTFNDYYVFTGPEREVMSIYLKQIAKASGMKVRQISDVSEIVSKLTTTSFLKNAEICVFYDCKEFITDDKLKALICEKNSKRNDIYIFIYMNIDRRTKFYKQYKDEIIDFEYLKPDILLKYIQKQCDLNEKNAKHLIEICECDYSRILLEIDKIKQFSVSVGWDENKSFENLIHNKVIYIPPKDAVFDFVSAVMLKNKKSAYELLAESYNSGEATLVLISNLYNSAKQTLQVQSYCGDNLIAATGLTPFQVKLAKEHLDRYSDDKLIHLMKLCREAERGIKIGQIEDSIAVEYILARFWN